VAEGECRVASVIPLDGRGVLAVEGPDRVGFLQGLVSNDVAAVGRERAVWAAVLTPQGKYLHDFFILTDGERLLLEMPATGTADLAARLRKFRLRSKVAVSDVSADFAVAVVTGAEAPARVGLPPDKGAAAGWGDGIAFVDPRHAALGVRLVLPRAGTERALAGLGAPAIPEAYERLRIALGIPDGVQDLIPEKSILLENGFDELHGVSWTKGCYMGQELTARTKYRALIKKRLLPVVVDGPLPAPGTPVLMDGKEAGEMRSGVEGLALALLRLESVTEAERTGTPLTAGTARLSVQRPDWFAP